MPPKTLVRITLTCTLCILIVPLVSAQDPHTHDASPTSQSQPSTAPRDDHDDHDDDHHDHAREVKLAPNTIERYGIRIEAVTAQPLRAVLNVPARIEFNAERMAHVGAVVRGRVTEIKARLGDAVQKGDELVVLESNELAEAQSEYVQRQSTVAVATSAVEPLKASHERARNLHEQSQGIALGEVQKREAELKAAEGAVITAKAAAVAAINRLMLLGMTREQVLELGRTGELNPRTVIRAPIDGRIVEREVTLGELVTPEKDALLVVADMRTVWVQADVPEGSLAQLAEGAAARVQITSLPKKSFDAKVAHIAPALDPHTRTAAVRVEVANDGALRPGMFATVELRGTAEAGESVLAVPESAVQTIEGQPTVFVPVKGEANTFMPRPLKIGATVNGMTPVLAGLHDGEHVVISGAFILKAELGKGEAGHGH